MTNTLLLILSRAYVMVAHYEIWNNGYLKCFVSSLELKTDRVTHEFNLHDSSFKIAPYTVSSGDVSSYTEPITA